MKKLLVSISTISILLSGCLGSSDPQVPSEKKIEGFHAYTTEEFSMQVADEWETLLPVNFPSNTPKSTIIGFRSNLKNPKFTANATLIKNELSQEISTLDYTKALREKTQQDLFDFREILTEQTKVIIGGTEIDTIFFMADGRESTDQNLKRFMQIAGVKGKTAYVATGSFLTEESEATGKKLETMLRNFEIK
jgi:hypothetical protein